jgi:uncharacterized membrane protein
LKLPWKIAGLSLAGVLVGTLFLAVSLAPSLLPRPFAVQGVLSGVSFAIGYGVGVGFLALWNLLHLPIPGPRLARKLAIAGSLVCAVVAIAFLWQASAWQNSIREMMGMEEAAGLRPAIIGPIALLVFIVLLLLARLLRRLFRSMSSRLANYVPPRVSHLASGVLVIVLFWTAIDGVLFTWLLRTADQSFQQLDALIEPELPVPLRAEQTGSAESLVDWSSLGRQGRRFVAGGPDSEALKRFFAEDLPAPLRVYVGLNSAETPEARARLALDELKRAGGFQRSVLILATPTGTGWIDAVGQDAVEYLSRGDIATVAVQYSYLNSPLALLTQAQYGAETARAVFVEIYNYWRALPADQRPRLYLTGLSLGSLNSDLSFDLFDIMDDPFDGALWVGPPFRNQSWRRMTQDREPGSPAWLPTFRNGTVVRFMNQTQGLEEGYGPWSDFRIVFLQYASDPITFFAPSSAWQEPDWMLSPRGPDVSKDLRWFPLVTMLQLAADMAVGTSPRGFGHEYAAADYIDAWMGLIRPEGWTEAEVERLRERLQ